MRGCRLVMFVILIMLEMNVWLLVVVGGVNGVGDVG